MVGFIRELSRGHGAQPKYIWWIPVNSYPCQLVIMSFRTHVNSYPCQLVPLIDVNSYHKWCQLVPPLDVNSYPQRQVSDDGIRVDIYYHTIDVNSYPCQLVPMSTRTTNKCQLVPQVATSDVNSFPTRLVSDDDTSWLLLPHNSLRCQLVPSLDVNSYQK